jgi:adenosylcobinamide-GDP ribazoletransferase
MQRLATLAAGGLAAALHQLRLFFIALQFFTRLPIPPWVGFEADWLQQAARYFPLVGIIVGATVSAVYAAGSWLWPVPVAVLLSTASGIYLTGAFHEDGFADVCDGFGGGMSVERVLDIMKDSRIGAYGAIGIGLLLSLKCFTLSFLSTKGAMAALLTAHPFSRLAAAALIWRLDYVRAEGKAKPLAQHMTTGEFLCAGIAPVVMILLVVLGGWLSWAAALAATCTAALVGSSMARRFMRRIGGYTGDCLGATQQLAEVGFYLAVLAVEHAGLH